MNATKKSSKTTCDPMPKKTMDESETLIKRMLSSKDFNYNKGLNYREYILAVWRTLLFDNSTSAHARKVLSLISEAEALELISKHLKNKGD